MLELTKCEKCGITIHQPAPGVRPRCHSCSVDARLVRQMLRRMRSESSATPKPPAGFGS
jgi:hypothetical protein